MKKFLCVLLALTTIFCMAACGGQGGNEATEPTNGTNEKKDITVVLDWTPNTNHSGLYAALDKGFYSEEGLNVTITQPPEDGAEALVASGKAQFGIGFQDTMVAALTADEPLDITAVAAVVQHNLSGIISRGDKEITSFDKLSGHSYATWGLPIEQAILEECVESSGGEWDKVKLVDTYVQDVMMGLDTDMIDSVWVYEYWDVIMAQVNNYDYNYFDFKSIDEKFDYYTPVILTSGAYLEAEPEMVKAFLRATAKGYEFCAENPSEAADILLKAAPELDEKVVKASAEFMAKQYVDENGKWGNIDPERWENFYGWLYEKKLTEENLGQAGLTTGYLPQ